MHGKISVLNLFYIHMYTAIWKDAAKYIDIDILNYIFVQIDDSGNDIKIAVRKKLTYTCIFI